MARVTGHVVCLWQQRAAHCCAFLCFSFVQANDRLDFRIGNATTGTFSVPEAQLESNVVCCFFFCAVEGATMPFVFRLPGQSCRPQMHCYCW